MKTKKTIRKLKSPLARDLAKLSRNLHSMRKAIDKLTDQVEDQAYELRMARKEINALHNGEMMPQHTALKSALSARKEVEELFADDKGA